MFFLFRAFFWLGLIMTVIWWSGGAGSRKPGAVETLQKETAQHLRSLSALAGTSLENAKNRLEKACLQQPKLCLDLLLQYNRDAAEKPQPGIAAPAFPDKPKLEAKHQNRAAPQGRDLPD